MFSTNQIRQLGLLYMLKKSLQDYITKLLCQIWFPIYHILFLGEDTSIGIWLEDSAFYSKVKFIKSHKMVNTKQCYSKSNIVIGHDLSPDSLNRCHNYFNRKPWLFSFIIATITIVNRLHQQKRIDHSDDNTNSDKISFPQK